MDCEYQFRVYDKRDKKWVDSYLAITQAGAIIDISEYAWIPLDTSRFKLQRCTGLKDKEGTFIFEGDILEMENESTKGFVWYYPYDAAYQLGFDLCSFSCEDSIPLPNTHNFKIIGNVYEQNL